MPRLEKSELMDSLFGIDRSKPEPIEEKGRQEVAMEQLYPSEHNHFKVEMDEAMEELIASIKEKGILMPLIVRPREQGGYEILSGHRRRFAALKANLKTLPIVVMDVSDEDRDIIIADSNLQRLHIRTSEKAWAIRLKYDAIKRKTNGQYENRSLGAPGAPNGKSAEVIAEKMGLSENTIKRNLRITYLIPLLLDLVDAGILPLKAGVQLSYLSEKVQSYIYDVMDVEHVKVNEEFAKKLREELQNAETMEEVFRAMKPEGAVINKASVKKIAVKINKDIKKKYFPADYSDEQINNVILEFLAMWAEECNPEYENYNPQEQTEE